MWKVKVKSLSRVQLFATPWTVAYQAPPSMGFSRQECWSGLPFPSPGDLPNPGIDPSLPHCRQMLYRLSHQGSPSICLYSPVNEHVGCFQFLTMCSGCYGLPRWLSGKESTCQAGDMGWEDSLEEEMATYSTILAWKMPWTEQHGGLQSIGWQRVQHKWVTEHTHTLTAVNILVHVYNCICEVFYKQKTVKMGNSPSTAPFFQMSPCVSVCFWLFCRHLESCFFF